MFISIDIGGTNVRIATISGVSDPKILDRINFPVGRNFDKGIKEISEQVKKLAGNNTIEGIGVTLPGIVNKIDGYIESSVNLSEWDKKPVKQTLSDLHKVEVKCEQDVSAGALGEAFYGAGKSQEKFVFMIWGTGFGGAVVEKTNDKVKVTQIETGHQIYDWNGPKCPCGQNGCFEMYIGGGFLKKLHKVNPEEITDDKFWDDLAQKAAHALINMVMNQPTDLIVYSGGLVSKQTHLIERIAKIFEQKQSIFKQPQHKLADLEEDAGLYGAVGLFRS